MCQYGVCVRENGFPSCAQWIFASKEAYSAIGWVGVEGDGAVMSVNTATKANSLQKGEDTDAVKLLRVILGTCQLCHKCWEGPHHSNTVPSPAGTRLSMPSQSLPAICENYFSKIGSWTPIIALEVDKREESTLHILFDVWHWLKMLHTAQSESIRIVIYIFFIVVTPLQHIWFKMKQWQSG